MKIKTSKIKCVFFFCPSVLVRVCTCVHVRLI